MRKTLQIITTILLTFIVPMLTSWLLDWEWIVKEWPRYVLVLILMVMEVLIGLYIFREVAKD